MAEKIPTPHSQFISHSNGQKTHFIIDDFTDPWKDDTQTVLIQHGFGRHFAFWYHWIPTLASKYRVIRRDLRGHGLSSDPTPDYDYSLDTVLGEIVDMLDQLKLRKIHFLCESTAGMIGVAFAAKHPDRLHSLTVCATPTHLPDAAKHKWSFGYKDWPTACREMGARGTCEAMTKLPGGIGQLDPDYHKWWLDQMDLSTGEGFARYADFLCHLDVRPLMKDVKCPVLILAPTNSGNTSIEDQKNFRDAIKGAKMVPIDGRAHEIYLDKAEECQKEFLSFLDSIK